MSTLFFCNTCRRYLNPKYYDRECCELHTLISKESPSYKCEKHHRLLKNCRICNPYHCPCGRTISNNKFTISGHELTKFHNRHIKKKSIQ